MHPSVDLEDLKQEIEQHNHTVVRISNIKQAISQKPLPLFFIEIESRDNNKEIFQIKKLMHTVISFEPPRKKREIPQCMNCQGFNHTKNYCNKSPVCVKCARSHLTRDCPIKEKTKEVICANCGGDHPASYKGCIVRKQLQQKLFPSLREKTLISIKPNQNHNKIQNNSVRPNVSFAQATSQNIHQTENQIVNKEELKATTESIHYNKLEDMMTQLVTRIDTMLNLLTCLINKLSK